MRDQLNMLRQALLRKRLQELQTAFMPVEPPMPGQMLGAYSEGYGDQLNPMQRLAEVFNLFGRQQGARGIGGGPGMPMPDLPPQAIQPHGNTAMGPIGRDRNLPAPMGPAPIMDIGRGDAANNPMRQYDPMMQPGGGMEGLDALRDILVRQRTRKRKRRPGIPPGDTIVVA